MQVSASNESAVPDRVYSRDSRGRFTSAGGPCRANGKAGRKNDTRRPISVAKKGLTKDVIPRTISPRLIEHRPNVLETLLEPLRSGKAVVLRVSDIRLPKKTRKYQPVLVICPLSVMGIDYPRLLVSMPPYGSELIDPSVDLKASNFARLGLSFSLASALSNALIEFYGGRYGTR